MSRRSQARSRIARLLLAILPLLLALPATAALREKTDQMRALNGDTLSCEIKELKLGKLMVKTDTMSTVYVKWEHVMSLSSSFGFRVETVEGEIYLGSLLKVDRDRILAIYTSDGQVDLHMDDVVRLIPVGQGFWQRLDGEFDLGFNYTKATDIAQLNTGFSTIYQQEKWRANVAFSSSVTSKSEDGAKRRVDLSGGYRRLYEQRFFANYSVGATRNDELGIDLRTYVTAGIGRYLRQSSHHESSGLVGLSGNREQASEDDSSSNLEGALQFDYAFYRFKDPEANLTTYVYWYPGLSQWGRHRIEYDARLKYELVSDFFWSLSFYYSFDNQPPGGASAKDDYGIVTSFGYTW